MKIEKIWQLANPIVFNMKKKNNIIRIRQIRIRFSNKQENAKTLKFQQLAQLKFILRKVLEKLETVVKNNTIEC